MATREEKNAESKRKRDATMARMVDGELQQIIPEDDCKKKGI